MKFFAKNGFAYSALFMFVTTFAFVLPLALLNSATKPLADRYWATAGRVAVLRSLGIAADQADPDATLAAYRRLATWTTDAAGRPVPVPMATVEAAELAGKPVTPLYYLATVDGRKRLAGNFTGLGLWSSITLVLGFDQDMRRLTGLRILSQAETPGLGGRITEPWFMDQFTGKQLAGDGPPIAFKTSGPPPGPEEPVVDGIAGATLTTNGIRDIILSAIVTMRPVVAALGGQP